MSPNLIALLYLAAGVLFILALRGLSSPDSSRRGNYLGMTGMAIAIATTLAIAAPSEISTWITILAGFAIGGRDRYAHRAPYPNDGNAATGRGLSQFGGHGGRLGSGSRAQCASRVFHR